MTAELVYCTAWYDGPIAGLARVDDRLCWFNGDPFEHRWTLYALTAEQLAAELDRKAEFEAQAGTHWSFDVPRAERVQRSQESQRAYFASQVPAVRPYAQAGNALGEITAWTNSLKRY